MVTVDRSGVKLKMWRLRSQIGHHCTLSRTPSLRRVLQPAVLLPFLGWMVDSTLSLLCCTLPLPQSLEPSWGGAKGGHSLCERFKEHSKPKSMERGYGELALCSFHHVESLKFIIHSFLEVLGWFSPSCPPWKHSSMYPALVFPTPIPWKHLPKINYLPSSPCLGFCFLMETLTKKTHIKIVSGRQTLEKEFWNWSDSHNLGTDNPDT